MKKAASPKNDEAAKICPLGTIQFCTGIVFKAVFSLMLHSLLKCSLSSGQSCDRHAERRAGNVVEADLVAELNGRGVTTVLTADTYVESGVNGLTESDSHVHQLANAGLVELSEGIVLEDLSVVVSAQELACVIAGEAVGHLGQVVGTEAEEVCVGSNVVSGQACARNLDHGTNLILQSHAGSSRSEERRVGKEC